VNLLEWAYIEFDDLREKCPDTGVLRSWINSTFPDNPLLHHHEPVSGRLIFQYPRIQYKIINGLPILYGLEDGVEVVEHIFLALRSEEAVLGSQIINAITLKSGKTALVETEMTRYSLLTPWLAFNANNLQKYNSALSWLDRKKIINSILVGNILSMAKTFGFTIDFLIRPHSKVDNLSITLPRHGLKALGLIGSVELNIVLPPLIGLGRHTSLGYGVFFKEEHLFGPSC
jgi:hypothetical protein